VRIRYPYLAALVAALLAVVPELTASDAAKGSTCKRDCARPAVYWGAQLGSHLTGGDAPYDMRAADTFERRVGKKMSLLQFSLPFAHCHELPCRNVAFPKEQMSRIRARGYIPVFGWASYSQPLGSSQRNYQLADVIAGRHDGFIRSWAREARRWRHPFFLRFNWEMNVCGLWPYSECRNGNRRGEFVRAWRHVHRLFRRERATNATWVWCPNIEYPESIRPLRRLYPGHRYVDWTCLDGYNWGNPPRGPGWRTFRRLFGPTYRVLTQRIAPRKPVMIAETASTDRGGSKARWIRDALRRDIPRRFPRIRAFMWFETNEPPSLDWVLRPGSAALSAFGRGIRSGYYATNRFGSIRRSPIRPPRRAAPRSR
jgi:hypothetical protein